MSNAEWQLFYNHSCECDSCSRYTVLHEFDSPIEPKFNEEGVSQSEFEKGIDEFYEAIKPKDDPIEAYEKRHNFKPIPDELMKHLGDEYGKPEPQITNNPYLEKINREFQEEEKETAQLNNLSQNKLRQWLAQKEEV